MEQLETSHEAYALLATAARQTVHQRMERRSSAKRIGNQDGQWNMVFQKEFLRINYGEATKIFEY